MRLGGAVEDYGARQQTAIKNVLAAAAGVATNAVTLEILAASVIINAEIIMTSQAQASNAAAPMATGIFSSETALQAALVEAYEEEGLDADSLVVEAITTAPAAQVASTSATGEGMSGMAIAWIVVAAVVVLLAVLAAVFFYRKELQKLLQGKQRPVSAYV